MVISKWSFIIYTFLLSYSTFELLEAALNHNADSVQYYMYWNVMFVFRHNTLSFFAWQQVHTILSRSFKEVSVIYELFVNYINVINMTDYLVVSVSW